jgi:glutathione synthase/RimK-type ligase-like ATP-grasp enzyme/gamma-glutamyl:cysteine ligase YbdK (ATP-grasp superfamily)
MEAGGGHRPVSTRRRIVVVSRRSDAAELPDALVATADEYLAGSGDLGEPGLTVVNLCRSYRYRTKGYYVSLLADARGQQVLPRIDTVEALSDEFAIRRALEEAGLPTARGDDGEENEAEFLTYLGRIPDPRLSGLAREIHRIWPAPVLRLSLRLEDGAWRVDDVSLLPVGQIPQEVRAPLLEALLAGSGLEPPPTRREETRASLAVLYDDQDLFAPSTPETIERLERVGALLGVHVRRLGPGEIDRLGEYDALFIRSLTGVREPSFQWALRAEALGMPVLDDPQSIIRCSNKVFLEELLRRERIPTPRTLVITPGTPWEEVKRELGAPVVVKLPDSSFSAAVHRISSAEEYARTMKEMLRRSPLMIAQEFLPTDFDWRITVLEGRVLFAARYFMAEGHWQIRTEEGGTERYGKVQAVPRDDAPRKVVEMALRAAALIGDGLYGVDIKETRKGPVIIEINDNPNIDLGDDDAADGEQIYRDLIEVFARRVEEVAGETVRGRSGGERPRERARREKVHYRPFEVAGIELEYALVDERLEPLDGAEAALRAVAGRPTSDAALGEVVFSNEIAAHVLEMKTRVPVRSLAAAETALAEGVRRMSDLLRREMGARLLPTAMHPWLDPRERTLWSRSGGRIYEAYGRIFDVKTHGWMNVHSTHLNLPLGREDEALALYHAAALLVPYLPALAASSPVHDGRLQPAMDARLAWIVRHQERLPESCGALVPEYVEDLADYRRRILGGMYAALDRHPDSAPLRHEFLNARTAVLRFSRKAMELRVLDTQECVKLDIAVAVFARAALQELARRIAAGKLALPDHEVLVADFHATVAEGSAARVRAPHLVGDGHRGDDGGVSAREALEALLALARPAVRRDEQEYLPLLERMIESGSLAERIRARLGGTVGDAVAPARLMEVYGELVDCLERNEPWAGRW